MRQRSGPRRETVEKVVKDFRRKTRRQFSAEEKIRVVLEGLRGEESIAELCRREGIATSLYHSWSKKFLETGKKRLAGDTARQATSSEVKELRAESVALKEAVADLMLENRLPKKGCSGTTRDEIPRIEKLEIICIVERSHLPVKRTLDMLNGFLVPKPGGVDVFLHSYYHA